MKRIMFVDDEPRILDGLKRMLRPQRKQWYMLFAESGETALEKLASEPFDVVVSDMRMPGMDGAILLAKVQDLYPDTVRIILSGHTELESALRAIPVAHQFLSKPCDAETIKEVIDRACNLNDLLNYDSVRRMVGKIKDLPAAPRVYQEVLKVIANPEASAADVANIVEQDMSICARILQTVNSGFFGLRQQMTSVPNAIGYLGMNMVKNLVLGIETFQNYDGIGKFPGFTLERQQRHAIRVANLAMSMFKETGKKDDAFVAGMMHDVGKIVLAAELPDHFSSMASTSFSDNRPMYEVELEATGVTHAEIGSYLLGLWGMPYSIVEAVANHHQPTRVQQREFGVVSALYTANILVQQAEAGANSDSTSSIPDLDYDHLELLLVADRVNVWKEKADDLVREKEEVI